MKKVLAVLFAVLLVAVSALPAFAAESPTGTFAYDVVMVPSDGGSGTADISSSIDADGNQHVLIKPVANNGYVFDYWTIEGSYKTDGKLTDAELELIVNGDVKVTPHFKKAGTSAGTDGNGSTGTSTTITTDNASTSPKTGSSDVAVFSVILLAAAVCGVATLKLVKSK